MYTCTNSTVAIVIDSGHFSVVTQVSYSVYIYIYIYGHSLYGIYLLCDIECVPFLERELVHLSVWAGVPW